MKAAVILVCAGKGERCNLNYNKVFYSPYLSDAAPLDQIDERVIKTSVLGYSLAACLSAETVTKVILTVSTEDEICAKKYAEYFSQSFSKPVEIAFGGETRTDSVQSGLLKVGECDVVAIHDGARPYIKAEKIDELIRYAFNFGNAVPCYAPTDSVYDGEGEKPLNRATLKLVQTPQCFNKSVIEQAFENRDNKKRYTDDASLVYEVTKQKINYILSADKNDKITYDYHILDFCNYVYATQGVVNYYTRAYLAANTRAGIGYDVHRLTPNRPLMLCGIQVPYDKGLLGHSDADAALHAIADALLSAAGERDIGYHFPDNDDKFLDMAGKTLLSEVLLILGAKGYSPYSVTVTIITDAPKLSPIIPAMKSKISELLNIPVSQVGVAATTGEGLGITDGKRAIAAIATATLQQKEN